MNLYKSLVFRHHLNSLTLLSPTGLSINRHFCRTSFNSNANQSSQEVVARESSPEVDKLYKTIEIEVRCADREVLNSYETFVKMSANCLGLTVNRSWEPFRAIKRRTLLRAAFVKKKYRVQYEFRTYFRNIEFKHLTASTADTLIEYIERNLPEGVALMVYRTAIETVPQHISQQLATTDTSSL
ncbi:28S ribosomal protein S10, mitochondrial-like [Oppia nitens]|uniref:28S ribosomal protein S10, mitochondrial-like n=1 Tax=Oppia nitens TaxID=1686743 RepID=UPI0023DA3D8D|nr:28S ribosomal protein S10, mitochondrial-like [Oppia nitens]